MPAVGRHGGASPTLRIRTRSIGILGYGVELVGWNPHNLPVTPDRRRQSQALVRSLRLEGCFLDSFADQGAVTEDLVDVFGLVSFHASMAQLMVAIVPVRRGLPAQLESARAIRWSRHLVPDVDLAGDGGGDEGGAVLAEAVDGLSYRVNQAIMV